MMTIDRKSLNIVATNAMVLALYVALAKSSSVLSATDTSAVLDGAPAGLAMAGILLLGYRIVPGLGLGALVVWASTRASTPVALVIAAGDTLEAVLGGWAMRRLVGFDGAFGRLRHVGGLIVPAAMMSTLVCATIGVASLTLGGFISAEQSWSAWQAWWVRDMLDVLVTVPVVVAWVSVRSLKCPASRALEATLLGCVLLGESATIFLRAPVPHAHLFQHPYVLFLVFIWAALRFDVRGAATATAVAFVFGLYSVAHGTGPFVRESLAEGLLALQTFIGCAAVTSLVVAGAMSDRARAIREAHDQARKLQVLAAASTSFAQAIHETGTILRELARLCTEVVGDSCVIQLASDDPAELTVAAFDSRNRAVGEAAETFLVGQHALRTGVTERVLTTLSDVLIPVVDAQAAPVVSSRAFAEFTRQCPVYSAVAVPLETATEVFGVVALLRHSARKPYTDNELTVLRDLADRAGLALYNAKLYDELRAAVVVRDEFLAIAGHELKTPLAALLMQIQSLQRVVRNDPSPTVRDRLAKAARSGLRMERLTNQLLDVSRIAGGKLTLEPERLELGELLREVAARFADASAAAHSPMAIKGETEVNGYWDRMRLDEVISNLLSNAMKYGQGKPVEIDLHTENGDAVLQVTDHGIGIDEAHQRKMFQKFERAVAVREFGGFGLGLWITRKIVEESGGRIVVQSTPGQGSVFTVRLPREHQHSTHGEPHAAN